MEMTESATTFSVRLPADLREAVDDYARATNRSRAFVIKEAVVGFMEEQSAYMAAIDEALIEADKGVFVSGEAVMEWLESWGTDNVKPMPEPDIFPDKPA
jgi:predicted transcriptional regulator